MFEKITEEVQLNFPESVAQLASLVKIPSVSWDGYDQLHVNQSAETVKQLFASLNFFDSLNIHAVADEQDRMGRPAVLGIKKAETGYPTVMLYAHHDVQPWGKESDWQTPPFQPTLKDGRLFARGSSDDKAGILVHYSALKALTTVIGTELKIGVVLFIEGEEEWGSRSFENFLKRFEHQMVSDVIIVADSDNWDTQTPALTTSLRGNVTFTLKLSTLEHASHSGMYGGAAPDAPLALIKTLNTLWDDNGAVAVDGLISHTAETAEFSETEFGCDAGLLDGVQPVGVGKILDRIWNQPAITVTGMDVTNVQDASNTLLPEISVKISARVAPGQRATEAFEAIRKHLIEHVAFGAHLEFSDIDSGDPFLVDVSGQHVESMRESMGQAWGKDAIMTGIGGSIPFIPELVKRFPKSEILVTGVEDPQTRAHSPNESQDLGVFRKAIFTEAIFLMKLHQNATN